MVSEEVILETVRKMAENKTPGLDSIPKKLKIAVKTTSNMIDVVISVYLRKEAFLTQWNKERLVSKVNKPLSESSSHVASRRSPF